MKGMDQSPAAETANGACRSLYKIGAISALIAAVVFRRNLDAEYMLLRMTGVIQAGPTAAPDTVRGWFLLLQNDRLLGLTLLNLFDLVNYVLLGWIFLALFAALRHIRPSFTALAASLGFLGVVFYAASNQALTLLSLSQQYTAAATEAERNLLLSAGQAALAIHQNNSYLGTGIYPSFLLVSLAGLILAGSMLRSALFNKTTAIVGMLANGIAMGYYIALIFARALVSIPLSASAPLLMAWYILIGIQLWKGGSVRSGLSTAGGKERLNAAA